MLYRQCFIVWSLVLQNADMDIFSLLNFCSELWWGRHGNSSLIDEHVWTGTKAFYMEGSRRTSWQLYCESYFDILQNLAFVPELFSLTLSCVTLIWFWKWTHKIKPVNLLHWQRPWQWALYRRLPSFPCVCLRMVLVSIVTTCFFTLNRARGVAFSFLCMVGY